MTERHQVASEQNKWNKNNGIKGLPDVNYARIIVLLEMFEYRIEFADGTTNAVNRLKPELLKLKWNCLDETVIQNSMVMSQENR